MPATNTTPETAIEITTLPYNSGPFDVIGLGAGTGYASTCSPDQWNATWWKYTPIVGQYVIAIMADVVDRGLGGFDNPTVSVWTGTPPALTQYEVNGIGDSQDFCGATVLGYWFLVPVEPGTTYYVQITQSVFNPSLGLSQEWTFQVLPPPNTVAPIGTLAIPDDTNGFRMALISQTDGAFLQYLPFPAGEFGAVAPNGIMCVQDGEADLAIKLYAADAQTVIASVDYDPAFVTGITHDFNNKFYVTTLTGGVTTLRRLSDAGVEEATWTLPNSNGHLSLAVTRDGGIIYYALKSSTASPIRAYDLVGSTALSDLSAGFAGERTQGLGDGWVNADGTICFGFRTQSTPFASRLRIFNAAGSVTATYSVGNLLQHVARAWDDTTFWVWLNTGPEYETFAQYALSDGSQLVTFQVPVGGGGDPAGQDLPFSMSGTCPLIILSAEIAAVAAASTFIGSPGPLAWVEARWRTPGSP